MECTRNLLSALVLAMFFELAGAQAPVADLDYTPSVPRPAFAEGSGPVVRIDEAHHNYHTLSGRYAPFANLLQRDGFRMESFKAVLSKQSLGGTDILVIANAAASQADKPPATAPASAFPDAEIRALHEWVEQGGSLLLIADHAPFSDAAMALAKAFGFEFIAGYALQTSASAPISGIATFHLGKGLVPTPLSRGRDASEQVDSVMTFTGSAFKVPPAATSVLVFQDGARSFAAGSHGPDLAGPSVPIAGFSQAAILKLGKGRVAVFGEAAMFTAQRGGPNRQAAGMNAAGAEQNYQFVLNLMHWLSRANGMQ